jgi:ABC-type dipeptide/oligopeptide/nickel transport system ATPase component
VENLRVTFDTEAGPVEAVRGVSFSWAANGWGSSAKAARARR